MTKNDRIEVRVAVADKCSLHTIIDEVSGLIQYRTVDSEYGGGWIDIVLTTDNDEEYIFVMETLVYLLYTLGDKINIRHVKSVRIDNNKNNHKVSTEEKTYSLCDIKKVIFNYPAIIVFWKDDSKKTVVKCDEDDMYDPEKGLLLAIAKKNNRQNSKSYYSMLNRLIPEEERPVLNNRGLWQDGYDTGRYCKKFDLNSTFEDFKHNVRGLLKEFENDLNGLSEDLKKEDKNGEINQCQ